MAQMQTLFFTERTEPSSHWVLAVTEVGLQLQAGFAAPHVTTFRSVYLSLQSASVKGVCHHALWLKNCLDVLGMFCLHVFAFTVLGYPRWSEEDVETPGLELLQQF